MAGRVPFGAAGAYQTILWAGAICGILDGLSAVGLSAAVGVTPAQVFQGIARGLLGSSAFEGGAFAVAVGVVAHFAVATIAAAIYYAMSRILPAMNEHAILSGVLYGSAVHLFMNFVVIPLSRIGPRPIVWRAFISIWVVHIVVVGPSIALTTRRFADLERSCARGIH